MKKCAIVGCNSHQLPKYVSLFHLVRKGAIREDWRLAIESLNGQVIDINQPLHNFFICDVHFDPKFVKTLGTYKRLTEDAVPTVFPNMLKQSEQEVQQKQMDDFEETFNMLEQMNEPPTDEVEDYPTADFAEAFIDKFDEPPANDFDERFSDIIDYSPEEDDVSPNETALTANISPVCSRKRTFDLEEATPRTLKRKCMRYKHLFQKKNNMLKASRRKLKRKENKIRSLESLLDDLQKKNLISENCSQILQDLTCLQFNLCKNFELSTLKDTTC